MNSGAEAARRVALLRELREPARVAAALDDGVGADPERVLAELEERGLQPWVPFEGTPAPVLLVRGRIPERPGVAIVGARASDPYGLACAAQVARDAAALGRAVISGGAEGCDAAAHRAALAGGGSTVVVLAFGHDHVYPACHRALFDEIVARGGALVSPYWPDTRPARFRFLWRNRVIAALAEATVVVRAEARSGALSTARAAAELGRTVLAVPGNVGEALSAGPNALLSRGARALTGRSGLARALRMRGGGAWPIRHLRAASPWPENAVATGPSRGLPEQSRAVLGAIEKVGSLDLDGLVVQTGLPVDLLLSMLIELEVSGWLVRLPGHRYGPGRRRRAPDGAA